MLKFKLARKSRSAYVRAECVAGVVEGMDPATVTIYLTGGAMIEVDALARPALDGVEAGLKDPFALVEIKSAVAA